jgi:uncharacterized protein YciI
MYAVVIVRYRQPVEEVIKVQELHRAYLRQLKADGVLIAAGPQDPRFGGMFLVRVPDDTPAPPSTPSGITTPTTPRASPNTN